MHLVRTFLEPETGGIDHRRAARPPTDAEAVGDGGRRVGEDVPPLADSTNLTGSCREPERLAPEPASAEFVSGGCSSKLADVALQTSHPSTFA